MSRVFDLCDDALGKIVGEFRYDIDAKQFSMTIFEDTPPEDLPLSLELFTSAGKYELGHEDVLRWLRGRICPPGRQNIKAILKELGLQEYDEFGILMHTMGRCGKDELYLVEREANASEA
jgi:hypothetical protein